VADQHEIVGYRFDRNADVFPATDPVARYLVVVSMALNDVLAATKRLVDGLEGDAAPYENVYEMRLAGPHIWEMLKFRSQTETSGQRSRASWKPCPRRPSGTIARRLPGSRTTVP